MATITLSGTGTFLQQCPFAGQLPLYFIDIASLPGRLENLFPDETNPCRKLAVAVQQYQNNLVKSWEYNDLVLRYMLGDSVALTTPPNDRTIALRSNDVSTLFATYRILDLEMLRAGVTLSTSPVPRINSILPTMLEKDSVMDQWNKLRNWQGIVSMFKETVDNISLDPQDVLTDIYPKLRVSLAHLQILGDIHSSQQVSNLLLNFCGAAMHYAYIKETSTSETSQLPGIPKIASDILERSSASLSPDDLSQYDPHTLKKMKNYLIDYGKNGDLRLSLHLSLLLTPLFLLMPIRLAKCQFSQTSLPQLCIALGNQKPDLLRQVENEIWRAIWKMIEDPKKDVVVEALRALVRTKPFVDTLALSSEDIVFSFFRAKPLFIQDCNNSLMESAMKGSLRLSGQNTSNTPNEAAASAISALTLPGLHAGCSTENNTSKSLQNRNLSRYDEDDVVTDEPAQGGWQDKAHSDLAIGGEEGELDRGNNALNHTGDESELSEEGDSETNRRISRENAVAMPGIPEPIQTKKIGHTGQSPPTVPATKTRRQRPHYKRRKYHPKTSAPEHSESSEEESNKNIHENDHDFQREGVKFPLHLASSWAGVEDKILPVIDMHKCNLDISSHPKTGLGRTMTAWGPNGDKHEFEPIAHRNDVLRNLDLMVKAIEGGYDSNGTALFVQCDRLNEPGNSQRASIFKIMTEVEYLAMEDSKFQDIFRRHPIVIKDIRRKSQDFESAILDLAHLKSVTAIQDQSYGPISDGRVRSGTLSDFIDASKSPNPKILNALHFPNNFGGPAPSGFSSDSYAQLRVRLNRAIPTGHTWWKIASLKGAFSHWHIDSDGFGTMVEVIAGAKLWIVGYPAEDLDPNIFNKTSLLFKETFKLDNGGEGLYRVEAIWLDLNSTLIMRPGTIHAVYSPDHAVCRGRHFYASSTIQDTFIGLIHAFMCDQYISNASHFPSRLILARMIGFFHSDLILNELQSADPARMHIPDPSKDEPMVDLLVMCAFGILINVLSFETYIAPLPPGVEKEEARPMTPTQAQHWELYDVNAIAEDDRKIFCLARGQALEIVRWINIRFKPGRSSHLSDASMQEIFWHLLITICKMLCNYKYLADNTVDSDGAKIDCMEDFTLARLRLQIAEVLTWARTQDEDSPILQLSDSIPHYWTLPLVNAEEILPDWLKDLNCQKILPHSSFAPLTLSELCKVGETRLDRKFASALQVKRESQEGILQTKKRKHSAS